MRQLKLALILLAIGIPAAEGQQVSNNPYRSVPRFDVSGGYNLIRANAPPGGCPCFTVNGGYISSGMHFKDWLSVAGEFTLGKGSSISDLGQNLTLTTYMAGPRVSYIGHRWAPYAQVMFGGAHAGGSYFPSSTGYKSSNSSWALSAGGGLDIYLTDHFAVRTPEIQYLRTNFANGGNDQQNQLMIGLGLVYKIGGRRAPRVAQDDHPNATLDLTCSIDRPVVQAGQRIQIIGSATTKEAPSDVRYSWWASEGTLEGVGSRVRLDTSGLPVGTYRVTGHATFAFLSQTSANCETSFRVTEPPASTKAALSQPPPSPPTTIQIESLAEQEKSFHEHVPDVWFDYDSYQLRTEAQSSIARSAEYLKSHPEITTLIAGYSDERGTTAYNLSLGEKRAKAVMNSLIKDGVDASRLAVISYGKTVQVCTSDSEQCWQQNRRAAFSMRR